MEINGRKIGQDQPCYIIAELSANHQQRFDIAVALVHAAKKAGADAVKLQTYTPDTLVDKNRPYIIKSGSPWDGTDIYELYSKAYMPWDWQPKLKRLADQIGITIFSTAYDITSVNFLENMGVPAYKIASFEITDLHLIQYIASKNKPMLISTGMASESEITQAYNAAFWNIKDTFNISLLKCTSQYPAKPESMNLKIIQELFRKYDIPIGLSNHSLDRAIPIAAVALGACMIEQHFTLSKDTIDGSFSLLPNEFAQMVQDVRTTEKALGNHIGPTESEAANIIFRRNPQTGKRGI